MRACWRRSGSIAWNRRNLVAVTVSEGIGTGLLINGQLARGLSSMAGEFGHVPSTPRPLVRLRQPRLLGVSPPTAPRLRYYLEAGGARRV